MHRNYRSDLWILIRRPHVLEWLQSLLAHIRPHSADHRRAVRVSHSFLRLFFFLLFMFLRLTRGGAASCVGVVTGLAFFYILLFAVASAASRLCICSEVPGIVRMFNSCRGFMYKPDLSLSGPPLPLPPAALELKQEMWPGRLSFDPRPAYKQTSLWGFEEGPALQSELLSRLLLTEKQAVDDAVLPQRCTDK